MATPGQYQSGTQAISPATGAERVSVDSGGAVVATVTTAAIAALAGSGVTADVVSTSITTVGNGTLTAAAIAGGLITRTGPVAAYTDTTDTGPNIVAQFPSFVSGATFFFTIKNATSFLQTINAGAGVTMPVTNIVGPWQEAEYFGTIGGTVAAPTVVFSHLLTTALGLASSVGSPQVTTINTVGAGVITAAAINGGNLARTGTQTVAWTDTTDTGTAIVTGNPGLIGKVGASFIFYYGNTTTWPVTLQGGVGVTVSGITVIPAGSVAAYLVTQTAANTITMVGIGVTQSVSTAVAIAGSTSGEITLTPAAIAGQNTLTLPAVTGTVASTSGANLFVADIYKNTLLTITNSVTPTLIPGLAAPVVVGTYRIRAALTTTPAATGGVAISFVLTTAVLSSCALMGTAIAAAAISTATTTTTTSATNIIAVATIPLTCLIEGTLVVSTAGTLSLFGCQNTQVNSAATINVGGYLELTRIA